MILANSWGKNINPILHMSNNRSFSKFFQCIFQKIKQWVYIEDKLHIVCCIRQKAKQFRIRFALSVLFCVCWALTMKTGPETQGSGPGTLASNLSPGRVLIPATFAAFHPSSPSSLSPFPLRSTYRVPMQKAKKALKISQRRKLLWLETSNDNC